MKLSDSIIHCLKSPKKESTITNRIPVIAILVKIPWFLRLSINSSKARVRGFRFALRGTYHIKDELM